MGIDAIGLNFYSRSPRLVTADEAKEISKTIAPTIARVGVFVNQTIPEVEWLANECRLDMVQFHGDESPEYFAEMQTRRPESRLIRAWRMNQEGLGGLALFLQECARLNVKLAGCLVDAHATGVFGGSGKTVDWPELEAQYDVETWPPLILAGGLNPANVAQAITATHPWGVDVASGVETAPGVKDLERVRLFVANARSGSVSDPGEDRRDKI